MVLCLPKQNNTDTSTNTNTNTSTNTSTNTNSSTNTNTSTYTSTSTNTDTSIDTEGKITSIVLMAKPSILIASATNNCFETNVELNVCIKYEGNDIFKYNLPTIEFFSINSFDFGNSIKSKLIDSTNKYTYSGFVAPQNEVNGQATFTLVLPTKGITYDPYKHPESIFITSCLLNSKQERMVSEPIILSFKAIDNNENQNRTTIATLTSPDLSLPISTEPIFYISFSNSMNEYSKNAVSISKLSDNSQIQVINGWENKSDNKILLFGPSQKLEATTFYQIKIDENNAIDWKGNPIVKFTPLTFKTDNYKSTISIDESNIFAKRITLNPSITVDFKRKVSPPDIVRNAIKIISNKKEIAYNLQWIENDSKAIITY